MSNPARLLLTQFEQWKVGSTSTTSAQQRGIDGPFTDEWGSLRRAFGHIAAIERLLDELAANGAIVTVYRKYLNAWTAAAATYPRGWDAQSKGEMLEVYLEHLSTLADRLDEFVPTLDDGGLESISKLVQDAAQLLSEDPSIPRDLRDHLTGVLLHTKRCVDEYDLLGDYEVARAVDELIATIGRSAHQSSESNRWTEMMNKFGWPFASGAAANILANPAIQQLLPGN